MADINVTVYDANRGAGANFTDNLTAAVAGNNYFIPNNGRVVIHALCVAGGTVTVETPNTVDANAVSDLALTATANKHLVFGPFPTNVYNDSQGRLKVTVSAATSLFAVRV